MKSWDPYVRFQSTILSNGLTVYVSTMRGCPPWVHMGFLVHCGAKDDPVGKEGLAHCAEHLVSRNALGFTYNDIEDFFDGCGGDSDLGGTDYFSTDYSFFVPNNSVVISRALEIFGGMLLRAEIKKGIELEKGVIIEEFNECYPIMKSFEIEREFKSTIFKGTMIERFTAAIGSPESVMTFSRGDLQKFYDKYYNPSNMSVVIIGGLTMKEAVRFVENSPFAADKKGERNQLLKPFPDFRPPQGKLIELRYSDYINPPPQHVSYDSGAAVSGETSIEASRILAYMLDSILMYVIRHRNGWGYSIEASYGNFVECYEFRIFTRNLSVESLEEISDVVDDSIASVSDNDDLFKDRKSFLAKKHRMVDLSGKGLLTKVFSDLAREDRILTIEEEINDLEKVTMDDVCLVTEYLRPEHRFTLIQRP